MSNGGDTQSNIAVTHAVYSQNVNDNILLTVTFEESPVFVGGEENLLSAIINFKYVGELPKVIANDLLTLVEPEVSAAVPSENKENQSGDNGWFGGFGKRISMQLTNTTRSLLLQELETLDEEYEHAFQDETLLLGYTQVFGYFTYNDQIFDQKKFQEIQKKSIVGGKIGGISGLEYEDNNNEGFLNNFTSGVGSMFNASMTPDDLNGDERGTMSLSNDIVPIFTTGQSILFPEIVFKPKLAQDLEKLYYVNMKLPKFVPPTYSSQSSLKISYHFIIGYQILDQDGNWCNRSLYFPLEIRPFINKMGQQPLYDLLHPKLAYPVKVNSMELSLTQTSFKNIQKKLKRKNSTVSTFNNELQSLESLDNSQDGDTTSKEKFLQFIKEMNDKNVNELIGVQEKFENEFIQPVQTQQDEDVNVKENLINIFNNPSGVIANIKRFNESTTPIETEDIEYHSQIPAKPQLNFILKRNGELITTISLSKCIMTFNEILKIHLSFQNSKVPITGLITKLIKVEKFNNDDFLKTEDEMMLDVELNSNFEFETTLSETLTSCFNVNEELSYDMLIPNDVIRTGQFKSNLLETRYLLLFKFVLLDKSDTEDMEFVEIYNDSRGSLYKGLDYIANGMEFYCKIPIILLSSYEQNFGTNKNYIKKVYI